MKFISKRIVQSIRVQLLCRSYLHEHRFFSLDTTEDSLQNTSKNTLDMLLNKQVLLIMRTFLLEMYLSSDFKHGSTRAFIIEIVVRISDKGQTPKSMKKGLNSHQ